MLPGMAASTSNGIASIAIVQFLIVLLLGIPAAIIVNLATHWTNRTGLIFLEVLGASFAVALLFGGTFLPLSRIKERHELEAGYTTILTEFNQVDGINSRTGQVVRTAFVRTARVMPGDDYTTGEDIGPIPLGPTPIQVALRTRTISATTGLSAIFFCGGFVWFWSVGSAHHWNPPSRETGALVALFFVMFAGFCGLIIAPIGAALFSIPRFYRGQLAGHFSTDRVFIGVPDNVDIVAELVDPTSPALPGARYRTAGFIVVESEVIVLMSRAGAHAVPYLTIPRSRIVSASIGSTSSWSSNNASYPDVALTLRKDNSTTIDIQLELAITKGGIRSRQIRDDTQWVVDWATAKR